MLTRSLTLQEYSELLDQVRRCLCSTLLHMAVHTFHMHFLFILLASKELLLPATPQSVRCPGSGAAQGQH